MEMKKLRVSGLELGSSVYEAQVLTTRPLL